MNSLSRLLYKFHSIWRILKNKSNKAINCALCCCFGFLISLGYLVTTENNVVCLRAVLFSAEFRLQIFLSCPIVHFTQYDLLSYNRESSSHFQKPTHDELKKMFHQEKTLTSQVSMLVRLLLAIAKSALDTAQHGIRNVND